MAKMSASTYLRLEPALKQRVEQYAQRHGLSFAGIVRTALVQFLDKQEAAAPARPPADYVAYGERKPYTIAESLDQLTGPVTGTVVLPHRIKWSGTPSVDLDEPGRLESMYRTVLAEASAVDDLNRFLNRDVLLRLWPTMYLPAKVRRLWEERFPELAVTSRAA